MAQPATPERAAILSATADLAARCGYGGLSTGLVCDRAGVDRAGFHRHFGDAEDAFCAVVQEGTDELLRRVIPAFAAQPRWADGLRGVAYALRDFLAEDRARAHVMVIESHSACARSRQIREEGMAGLTALIDLARAQLDDPDSVPESTAALTGGVVYNHIHRAVEGEADLSDEMVRELMYSVVRPYLGPEAALAELGTPRPGT